MVHIAEEARIRYTQAQTHSEALFHRVREYLNSGIEVAEEKLYAVLEILTGGAWDRAADASGWAAEKGRVVQDKAADAGGWAAEKGRGARDHAADAGGWAAEKGREATDAGADATAKAKKVKITTEL